MLTTIQRKTLDVAMDELAANLALNDDKLRPKHIERHRTMLGISLIALRRMNQIDLFISDRHVGTAHATHVTTPGDHDTYRNCLAKLQPHLGGMNL